MKPLALLYEQYQSLNLNLCLSIAAADTASKQIKMTKKNIKHTLINLYNLCFGKNPLCAGMHYTKTIDEYVPKTCPRETIRNENYYGVTLFSRGPSMRTGKQISTNFRIYFNIAYLADDIIFLYNKRPAIRKYVSTDTFLR